MSRPRILDQTKRAEICALLAAGCSQEVAARYAGVTSAAIRNAAHRDPAFREQILKALSTHELDALNNIRAAAGKSWRAAAWLLERTKPQQYGYRYPRHLDHDYWAKIFEELMGLVEELLPDPKARYEFCRRMDRITELSRARIGSVKWPFGPTVPTNMPPLDAVHAPGFSLPQASTETPPPKTRPPIQR